MTLPSLLTFGYWFRLYPLPLVPVLAKILLLIMIAILCAGVGITLYARLAKGLQKQARVAIRSLGIIVLWAGIVGLYLYAMTWQTVPVLGMRVWYIVWFVLFAWLIARATKRFLKDVPAGQAEERARHSYEKWLPKPKK